MILPKDRYSRTDPTAPTRDDSHVDVMPLAHEAQEILQSMGEMRGRMKKREEVVAWLRGISRHMGPKLLLSEWVERQAVPTGVPAHEYVFILAQLTRHLADRIEANDLTGEDPESKGL